MDACSFPTQETTPVPQTGGVNTNMGIRMPDILSAHTDLGFLRINEMIYYKSAHFSHKRIRKKTNMTTSK